MRLAFQPIDTFRFNLAVPFVSDKKFKEGLNGLKEMYRSMEESKRYPNPSKQIESKIRDLFVAKLNFTSIFASRVQKVHWNQQ